MKPLSILLLLVVLVACGRTQRAYAPSGAGEPAKIVGHGVTLREVNGVPIGSLTAAVEVLSGRNEILFTVNPANLHVDVPSAEQFYLEAELEPAVTYAVASPRGDGRICLFKLGPSGQPDFSNPVRCAVRK